MKVIKFIMLSVLFILLIATFPLTLVAHSLQSTLLKPYALNDYFSESGFYQALSVTIQTQLEEHGLNNPNNTEEQQLFDKSVKESIKTVVTEKWLNDRLGILQNQLWDYLLGNAQTIHPIDISDLHNAIMTSARNQLSRVNKVNLPQNVLDGIINKLDKQIPNRLDVLEVYQVKEDQLQKLKKGYQVEQQVVSAITLLVISLIILGLIIAFYFKYALRWFGYLNVTIGLCLLTALLFLRRFDLHRFNIFNNPTGPLSMLKESMYQLVLAVHSEILQMMLVVNIIIGVIGVSLIVLSHFPVAKRVDAIQRGLCLKKKYRWIRLIVCIIIVGSLGLLLFSEFWDIIRFNAFQS